MIPSIRLLGQNRMTIRLDRRAGRSPPDSTVETEANGLSQGRLPAVSRDDYRDACTDREQVRTFDGFEDDPSERSNAGGTVEGTT